MCGNVGAFGSSLSFRHRDYFNQALYADAVRGYHGTGVAIVRSTGKVDIFKRAIPSYDFLDNKRVDNFLKNEVMQMRVLIGHNRHATKGGISDESTHPFQHRHITMVHNGSLTTTHQLPEHKKFQVDSDNIAYSLSAQSVDETVKNLNGSFSLVWYDAKENTLNFIRNKERPMHIAKIKNEKSWLYASEPLMLAWLATRNKLDIEEMFSTDELKLYTFSLEKDSFEMTTRELEEYKSPFQYNNNNVSRLPARTDTTVEKLKSINLSMGQRVTCCSYTFDPYNSYSDKGILTGYMENDPWEQVIVYNVDKPKSPIGSVFTGEIVGYRDSIPSSNGESAVILSPKSIKEVIIYEVDTSRRKKGKGGKNYSQLSLRNGAQYSYYEDKCYEGPSGIFLTGEQWDDLTRQGCSNCTGNLDKDDHDKIVWHDSQSPICPDCVESMANTKH